MDTQEWLNHPIIRDVLGRLPKDPSPLDVLTETLRVMHELDDRFPGATTAEILSARRDLTEPKRIELRERLLAAGASPEDVSLVAPYNYEIAAESPMTQLELMNEYEIDQRRAEHIASARTPPRPHEREIAALAEEHGVPAAAKMTGKKYDAVRRALGRVRYERLMSA